MPRQPVSVSLGDKELKVLDRLAHKYHQTRSAFLKIAILEYAKKLEFEELARTGQTLARAKGYFTDEDIFRVIS